MEILDRGYSFNTVHNEDGNVAHVVGHYRRFQTEAPIERLQDFELAFYGRGAGLELGVTAIPRRAAPAAMAAVRRSSSERAQRPPVPGVSTLPAMSTAPGSPSPASTPSMMSYTVGPQFDDPFDNDWFDWGLDPLPLPPLDPPGGGGGGGGGTYQSAVRIQLFVSGSNAPVETWELPEGVGDYERKVKYEPEGFPTPDAPVRRTTWWRMVVTPLGPDPVKISIAAHVGIADVPIRTTPLNVRLTNHLFRVALEALVPRAVVTWDRLFVSIGPEIADLAGIAPTILDQSISPGNSHAQLRSLDITTVSGQELHAIALEHYRERVKRYFPNTTKTTAAIDATVAMFFKSQLTRLTEVQPDDVCIRIQAAFSDASLSVWGFDVASLRGELGELILAFDHRLGRLRAFSFLDVDFSALASIALPIVRLFTEVPKDVNKAIEDHLTDYDTQQQILKYMRAFLARAVGLSSTVYDFKLQDNAWQIRHSDDPVIPLPGRPTLPPVDTGPLDGGVVVRMLARHNEAVGTEPASPAEDDEPSEVPAVAAAVRELPASYLTEGEQLDRLDRHQCIVVVMMENRSYDHMLGDLSNARPRTTNAYDGVPHNGDNAGVAGLAHGVPLVHTRDLRLGTAIPVSPRHSFDPVQFQIGDGTEDGLSSGDMLGFARDLYHRTDSPQLACTVYGELDLPVHYKLADEFLTCDRWFAAHPGPTFPNRFATIMGTIPDLDNFENDDSRLGYLKTRNVFDALSAARIEWRVFESDLSLIRLFDRYRLDDSHVVPLDDPLDGLEATLRKPGPLPRVMFVEPNFADIPPLKTADDDHPPADLAHGQAFLSRVCDLLWDTGRFDEVLLVITYDEHGGFYDHVPPPGTPKGEPGPYPPLIEGGPTWLGVRVPTFVVSPFVSAGAISRTIFDHTSIIKTILVHNRDRLSTSVMLGFGERVNEANDLSAVLDLANPRQAPVPFVRRAAAPSDHSRFGDIVDLESIVEVSPGFITDGSAVPISGVTPRNVLFNERTNPPADGAAESRDYHAALAGALRPRRGPNRPT